MDDRQQKRERIHAKQAEITKFNYLISTTKNEEEKKAYISKLEDLKMAHAIDMSTVVMEDVMNDGASTGPAGNFTVQEPTNAALDLGQNGNNFQNQNNPVTDTSDGVNTQYHGPPPTIQHGTNHPYQTNPNNLQATNHLLRNTHGPNTIMPSAEFRDVAFSGFASNSGMNPNSQAMNQSGGHAYLGPSVGTYSANNMIPSTESVNGVYSGNRGQSPNANDFWSELDYETHPSVKSEIEAITGKGINRSSKAIVCFTIGDTKAYRLRDTTVAPWCNRLLGLTPTELVKLNTKYRKGEGIEGFNDLGKSLLKRMPISQKFTIIAVAPEVELGNIGLERMHPDERQNERPDGTKIPFNTTYVKVQYIGSARVKSGFTEWVCVSDLLSTDAVPETGIPLTRNTLRGTVYARLLDYEPEFYNAGNSIDRRLPSIDPRLAEQKSTTASYEKKARSRSRSKTPGNKGLIERVDQLASLVDNLSRLIVSGSVQRDEPFYSRMSHGPQPLYRNAQRA